MLALPISYLLATYVVYVEINKNENAKTVFPNSYNEMLEAAPILNKNSLSFPDILTSSCLDKIWPT